MRTTPCTLRMSTMHLEWRKGEFRCLRGALCILVTSASAFHVMGWDGLGAETHDFAVVFAEHSTAFTRSVSISNFFCAESMQRGCYERQATWHASLFRWNSLDNHGWIMRFHSCGAATEDTPAADHQDRSELSTITHQKSTESSPLGAWLRTSSTTDTNFPLDFRQSPQRRPSSPGSDSITMCLACSIRAFKRHRRSLTKRIRYYVLH